jgi:hypothetical protein
MGHSSYIQGFGIPAKAQYCSMFGGNIVRLADDIKENLSNTPIGKDLKVYLNFDESITIKVDRQPANYRDKAKRTLRNIINIGKKGSKRRTEFQMSVLIDEGGADLDLEGSNLERSENWKEPLYRTVLETVKSQAF